VIDVHCHILPGIDDGPPDLDGAVALARAAAADGTKVVAATPHVREDHPLVDIHDLAVQCARLNDELLRQGVPLTVMVGGEVDILWARTASADELRLVSYGQRGRDLLLETPYGPVLPSFEEWIFSRLSVEGYRVTLAHPERNPGFQSDPERLAEMVDRGVLLQVTASSLVAGKRSASRKLALWLMERELAHVIASDAHRATDFRPPQLSAGLRAAAAVSPERALWMVTEAPRAILVGDPLPPVPKEPRRRGLLGSWRPG
jgi:protein-tyrosine phosphatase